MRPGCTLEKSIVILCLISILYGCVPRRESDYRMPVFEQELAIAPVQLCELSEYNYIHSISVCGDYLVMVAYNLRTEQYLHLVDKKTGEIIRSTGSRGRGPGELMGVPELSCDSGKIFLYDRVSRKTNVYDIEKLLLGLSSYIETIQENNPPLCSMLYGPGGKRLLIDNESYTKQDTITKPRIVLFNGAHISTYEQYPLEDRRKTWFMYSSPDITVSPDFKKMAIAPTGAGGGAILERFDMTDRIRIRGIDNMIPVDFEVEKGDIVETANSMYGFNNLTSTERRIYGGMVDPGISLKEIREKKGYIFPYVVEFDWNGKAIRRFRLHYNVENLAVEKDGSVLYIVYGDKNRNNYLGRIAL